jgi:uncharacterized protein (DUF1697 family)
VTRYRGRAAKPGTAAPPILYAAFLRGINVGGHAPITMADLKTVFEGLGFKNVETMLASGNVVFETKRADQKALRSQIEAGLKKSFKKDIGVLLRRVDDLKKLRASEPFRGITAGPGIRFYITFLSEKTGPRATALSFAAPGKELRLLRTTPMEVFSVVDLSGGKGTTEAMARMEKEFGPRVTTRNWNTILKILG